MAGYDRFSIYEMDRAITAPSRYGIMWSGHHVCTLYVAFRVSALELQDFPTLAGNRPNE
jgi:hypothetical protein